MFIKGLNGVYRYRWLLQELVDRDLKVKYKRSYLGYLWSLLNPLLMMAVVSMVFSHVFRFNIENFPLYLLCGQVLFNFFAESTNMAMNSILQNAGLIKKVYIPKYILPLSKIMSCFVNLLWSMVAIVIMFIAFRIPFYSTTVIAIVPIIYVFVISYGMGLLMSVLATYFRDMVHLYTVFIQVLTYLTPLFYPADILPEPVFMVVQCNPMYHIVTYFREVALYGNLPTLHMNLVCIGYCILFMTVGGLVFKKYQKNFLLYI